MEDHFFLTVPGIPAAKSRPRMTRAGIAYTPKKTRDYESDLRILARQQRGSKAPFDGPLRVKVCAFLPVPESWPKWKSLNVTDHGVFISHTSKPDIDNLAKVIDGLNGIVWVDDSQISDLEVHKRYAHNPRLEVAVIHYRDKIHSKTRKRP